MRKKQRYYEENKEWLQKTFRDRYSGLSEEQENKKRQYSGNRYWNMFEKDRQKLIEHKKNQIHGMSQEELQ